MAHVKAPSIVKDELQNLLRGLAKELNRRVYGTEGVPAVWRQDRRHLDHQDGLQAWWVDALVVSPTSASPPAELLNQFSRASEYFRTLILYLES